MASLESAMPADVRNNIGQVDDNTLQQKSKEIQELQNYLNMELSQRDSNRDEKELSPILDTIKANLDKERAKLEEKIGYTRAVIRAQEEEIGNREMEIETREQILKQVDGKVDEHKDLLNVRNRMLQLSQEKNIYKQKVIYTLISLIIGVFLVMIVGYVYFGNSATPT